MSTISTTPKIKNTQDIQARLQFSEALQNVTNRIHAAHNIDEIMLDLGQNICDLFHADRITIYTLNPEKTHLISKIKLGLTAFKELKIKISASSIAGYVALHKTLANIHDVYSDEELRSYSPEMHFLQEIDKRTGYRTKQMLVAPICSDLNQELIGVIQIINHLDNTPFTQQQMEGMQALAKTMSIAFRLRQQAQIFSGGSSKFDTLISEGLLSTTELEQARQQARQKNLSLEGILHNQHKIAYPVLGKAYAKHFHCEYEPYRGERIKPIDLLKGLSQDYSSSNAFLPLERTPSGLLILSPDPERCKGNRQINEIFAGSKIIYLVTTEHEFSLTLTQFYGAGDSMSITDMIADLDDDGVQADASIEISAADDNEVVKLVNKIIMDAYDQGTSDIHIEPYPGNRRTEVRFRRDGSLMLYSEIPASYRAPLVARIKIMCDLDTSERRKSQDGKIKFKRFNSNPHYDIELRVVTVPTQGGLEDVVMRILAAGEPLPLNKLALSAYNEKMLREVVSKPYGLFFVCGPTGSGKTTTLHSVLKHLNTPETKIWTAEDPVEITQKGLRQVQMNPKAGVTFATAMKSFLRADPDIIMVGEMRDKETAAIGVEASLTGHLVLATLHTNSAPESIIRLLDMGMDPFNFADAILGILAQRLAKRLCACKIAYHPEPAEIEQMLLEYSSELTHTDYWKANPELAYAKLKQDWISQYSQHDTFTLYKPVGCPKCNDTGYKGRVGLHELLVGTDTIKKNIQEHARVAEMLKTALNEGMRTLKQDGIEKVLQGITDMAQVRVVCMK